MIDQGQGERGQHADLAFSTLNHSPMFGCRIELEDQIRAASDAGFDAVSLDVFSLRDARERGTLDRAVAALADGRLRILDISALILPEDRDRCRAAIEEMVDLVAATDPQWVMVKVDASAGASATDRLREAAEALGDRGPGLAIEPSPVSDLTDPIGALDLIGSAGGTRCGIVLDTWHACVGGWPTDVLDRVGPDGVAYVQVADGTMPPPGADLVRATLAHRAVPGDGTFDLHAWFAALGARGFGGPVCVEVLDSVTRSGSVAALARDSARATRPLLELLAPPGARSTSAVGGSPR